MIQLATDPNASRLNWRAAAGEAKEDPGGARGRPERHPPELAPPRGRRQGRSGGGPPRPQRPRLAVHQPARRARRQPAGSQAHPQQRQRQLKAPHRSTSCSRNPSPPTATTTRRATSRIPSAWSTRIWNAREPRRTRRRGAHGTASTRQRCGACVDRPDSLPLARRPAWPPFALAAALRAASFLGRRMPIAPPRIRASALREINGLLAGWGA